MGAPDMYPGLYRDHMTGDPAYDNAFATLADCPSFAQIEQALKTYAHELAEKQRAFMDTALKMSPWATGRDGRPLGIDALIDLIDPEVSK